MRLSEIKPQFIIIIGGAGSGKNYYIEHHPIYSKYTLIDVDVVKKEIGVSAAIGSIKPMLISAFEKHKDVVHPGTAANLKAGENKIRLAHNYGYNVTLILIATDPNGAISQVQKRVNQGGHDVELDNIVASNQRARENFQILKSFADNAIVINNSIKEDVDNISAEPLKFEVKTPAQFTKEELNSIIDIITSEGQVTANGLLDRVKRAKFIGIVRDMSETGKIIAVSAIKIPNASYFTDVFTNAKVPKLANQFQYEMGWKVVLPKYRGQNLGEQLSKLVLSKVNSKVFATIRATNAAAITSIKRLGFSVIGEPYIGSSGNKILLLVKN